MSRQLEFVWGRAIARLAPPGKATGPVAMALLGGLALALALPGCAAVQATAKADVKATCRPADPRPSVEAGLSLECRWGGRPG